jgi:hypothetical protein
LSLIAHKGQTQHRDKYRDAQKIRSIHSKNLQLTGTVALRNAHMRRHKLHFSPTLTASSRGDLHKNIRCLSCPIGKLQPANPPP